MAVKEKNPYKEPRFGTDRYHIQVKARPVGGFEWTVFEWRVPRYSDRTEYGWYECYWGSWGEVPTKGTTRRFSKAARAAADAIGHLITTEIVAELNNNFTSASTTTWGDVDA